MDISLVESCVCVRGVCVFFVFFCLFICLFVLFVFFFFQAEDGIRDIGVTGVQTCALPISLSLSVSFSHVSNSKQSVASPMLLLNMFQDNENHVLLPILSFRSS